MTANLTAMQRAERTASRHQGVLDHAHAVAAGMSDAQIHRAVASGRWRRVAIGVYVVAGAPATARQRTMVAYLASRQAGGVVSHLSAAAEWGLLPPPRTAHVTVPPGSSARLKVARVHRSVVAPIDRAHRGGLLVTSVSRTIIDVAAVRGQAVVEAVVDAAFCRRQATAASVVAALDRIPRGRAGKALAREVIDVWTPRIEPGSPAEIRLLRAAAVEGIVDLVPQYEVFDDAGGFVARLDLAQPRQRRGFEYDGVEWHNPRQWARDETRYSRLRAVGWSIEPITKLDLLPGERRLRDIAARWGVSAAA